mmetsp:Transcript_3635/g.7719  ORF Transcript_3635/g.7719 Transcript_3635/m.7719 type:complete len:271 (+) Transcript_3635:691-1503(+)
MGGDVPAHVDRSVGKRNWCGGDVAALATLLSLSGLVAKFRVARLRRQIGLTANLGFFVVMFLLAGFAVGDAVAADDGIDAVMILPYRRKSKGVGGDVSEEGGHLPADLLIGSHAGEFFVVVLVVLGDGRAESAVAEDILKARRLLRIFGGVDFHDLIEHFPRQNHRDVVGRAVVLAQLDRIVDLLARQRRRRNPRPAVIDVVAEAQGFEVARPPVLAHGAGTAFGIGDGLGEGVAYAEFAEGASSLAVGEVGGLGWGWEEQEELGEGEEF